MDWWPSWPIQGGRFNKIDLNCGYHRVPIEPTDVWKIAFKSKEGLFEWLFMPFRVEKCPSKFYEVDGWHIAAFLQLVFGCIPGWHHHLHQEFGRALTTYSTSPSNPMTTQTMCQLGEMFLWHEPGLISGYIIDEQGMHMDLSKIQVIIDWIALTTLKFIHIFLGLANFYWRFMLGFSHIT